MDMYDRLALDCKRSEGVFGVEIECEGANLPIPMLGKKLTDKWDWHKEGSIRGEGAEYVFNRPRDLIETKEALDELQQMFLARESVIDDSIRAGVHVHLNVQSYTPLELFTFLTTYYMLEDYFVEWCGPQRIGNHFCLRLKDAEALAYKLKETCETKDWRHLNTDTIRYSALNLYSLFKFGSVEFRSMRATGDMSLVFKWVELINQLVKGAKKFDNPRAVVEDLSAQFDANSEQFIRYVMEDYADEFLKFKHLNVIEGMRYIQPMVMLTDWDKINKQKVNPFK